jgi:hypothetical protein
MQKLIEIFGTQTKAMEILSIMKDLKPVTRQGFYDGELPKVEIFCKQNKLIMIKSEFKVKPVEQSIYSNKGIKSSINDKEGMYFVYISKDELLAYRTAYFEIKSDHFNLGRILGYPECCSRFFENQFPVQSKSDNNYEIPVLNNSSQGKYHFFNNIFIRDKFCLLSHFPCSLSCEQSMKIAKNNLKMIKGNHPELAKVIVSELKKPVTVNKRIIEFY